MEEIYRPEDFKPMKPRGVKKRRLDPLLLEFGVKVFEDSPDLSIELRKLFVEHKGDRPSKWNISQKGMRKHLRKRLKIKKRREEKVKTKKGIKDVTGKDFLETYEWRKLRYKALKLNDGKCCLCGNSRKEGAVLNVDHIKPRKTHPGLALELSNLQVLCHDCNHGKGNWDQTDWR